MTISPHETLLEKTSRTEPLTRILFFSADPIRANEWGAGLYEIANRISLTATQYDAIETHYDEIGKIIDDSTDPRLREAYIFVQGSIRARTAVLPRTGADGDHAEVDADVVVWLPRAGTDAMAVFKLVEDRLRAGTRTKTPPSLKNRCVRLHYKDESPPFHMDVTPARNAVGNIGSKGEGVLLVPDRSIKDWKDSAPLDYGDWFASVCDSVVTFDSAGVRYLEEHERKYGSATQEPLPDHNAYIDFNPLRAAVKLLKAHRDGMFLHPSVSSLRPISIIITTLAARAYEKVASESRSAPRNPGQVLIEIVERMPSFITGSTGSRVVANPVIRTPGFENFAEKWQSADGAALEHAFLAWHRDALCAVRLGMWRFGTQARLDEAVRHAFGMRATRNSPGFPAALPYVYQSTMPTARGPKEQFIEDHYPVDETHRYRVEIDCEERKGDTLVGSLRNRTRFNTWLPYNRKLRFKVVNCSVPPPYQLFWKVRNVGPVADRTAQQRGELIADKGSGFRDETTSFSGRHYVEAYVVKNGVCVARAKVDVPISSQ